MSSKSLRHQVLGAYKELLFLGRNYPAGYQFFRDKLHDGFARQRHLTDEDEIRKKLAGAEYIKKEILALSVMPPVTPYPTGARP